MQILSLSLLLPIAYLSILIGSLATFSHLYRRRQLHAKLQLAPYFPTHITRNVYLSLLHLPDHATSSRDDKGKPRKVPDSVLRAALLSRACTDIERIMEIRTRKPALNQLLQRGVVGDEIWQRLLRAEQEMEMEVKDVVSEANALAPGWGAVIFQSAGEMVQNRVLRQKLDKVKESTAAEKAEWEKTKEQARKELMEGGDKQRQPQQQQQQQQQQPSKAPAVAVVNGDAGHGSRKASTAPKPVAVTATVAGSSDDEAVLVEREATEGSQPTTTSGGGGGGGGKKKNKKKHKGNKQSQGPGPGSAPAPAPVQVD